MFAFEYAALFRGMLPGARRIGGMMLPLGGTSNHFRTRRARRGRRLGPVQRHRGCRPRHAAGAFRLPHRGHLMPDPRARAETFRCLAAATHALVQGLGADMARPYAQSRSALSANSASSRSWSRRCCLPACSHRPCFTPAAGDVRLLSASNSCYDRSLGTWGSTLLMFDVVNIVCGYPVVPAARLADADATGAAGLLEDRSVHAALLGDPVGGRLAGALVSLAPAPSLGKDPARTRSPAPAGLSPDGRLSAISPERLALRR